MPAQGAKSSSGPARSIARTLRSSWLPLITGILASAASVLLWHAELRDDRRKVAVFAGEQARSTANQLGRGIESVSQALVRLVQRNGVAFRESDEWSIELPALKVFLWVEPSGQVHWVIPRKGNEAIQAVDFSASDAVRSAGRSGAAAVARSIVPPSGEDSRIDIAVPVRDGERLAGFLVGIFSTHELYGAVLSSPTAATGWDVSVWEGDREVYRRGSPDNWAAEVSVDGVGAPTRLRVAARPEVLARVQGALPRVILTTGLLISFLLAATFALAQSAGRRADQMRDSDARLRHFFEANLAGAIVMDPEGHLLDTNPAALRMFGLDAVQSLETRHISTLFANPDRGEEILALVAEKERIDQVEMDMRTANGRSLTVLANLVGRRDSAGRLIEVHGFLLDITEKRRVEAQLRQAQKMDAIGRLAGGVAHDFNNLLGVITGYGELLERDLQKDHKGHGRLREIRRAAESASTLTRQLLTFSRQGTLETRVLDLNELVPTAEKMLRRLIGDDVELITSLAPGLGHVRADAVQIEQVIMNLAINARDAMPRGGRVILETANVYLDEPYRTTHPGVVPGPYVMLAVSDSGHGMDADTLAHLFEPFFTTKEKGRGTGLGLATVYGIVQRSGGSVNVYSEPGHGTSFKVYLPRIDDVPPAPKVAASEVVSPRGAETILLVEDSEPLREMIREVLETAGYVVSAARSAVAAADAVLTGGAAVDLLLTDVIMPGLAGPDLAARLRSTNPRARVLYMSGYTDEMIGARGRGLEPGTHFLQKPFTFEALLQKVRDVLDASI